MNRLTLTATTALLLAPLAPAQQPIVNTVLNNGPTSTHYDLVILGDGYQVQEQAHFNQDVQAFLTGLFQKSPYSLLVGYFNVHTVFRASQDSGATHPDATPPIFRNTAYGASYNTGGVDRCLYITDTGQALADAALAPANETRVLVMVNDLRYGGCAGQFAVSYNGASMIEVQSHEMGHAVAQLADEYDYPNGNYTGTEPGQVNITTNNVGQKWSHWWGVENVGAFQGAGYYLTGLWRPRSDCLMRSLGVTLCPICREQIVRRVNAVVVPIQSPLPFPTSLQLTRGAQQAFSFTNLVPPANNPVITWTLDGQTIVGQTGTAYTVDSTNLTPGLHQVAVSVQDNLSAVRSDPQATMRETRTWNVTVVDNTAVNLRPFALQAIPGLVVAGSDFDIHATIINDGPGVATNVVFEQFLSFDATVDASDVSLGGMVVPTVGAGQQVAVQRRVHLPAFVDQRAYVMLGIVDRANAIAEINETDNLTPALIAVQTAGCAPALEYRDASLYPRDHGGIAIAAGGTLQPTVVARCAAPGTFYALVWGCSGTAPGTTLAPGVVLPLNLDACTTLSIDNWNSSVFGGFFGLLDTGGIGRANVAWPSGLPIAPAPGHFAAVLLDPSGQLVAVPVALGFDLN